MVINSRYFLLLAVQLAKERNWITQSYSDERLSGRWTFRNGHVTCMIQRTDDGTGIGFGCYFIAPRSLPARVFTHRVPLFSKIESTALFIVKDAESNFTQPLLKLLDEDDDSPEAEAIRKRLAM